MNTIETLHFEKDCRKNSQRNKSSKRQAKSESFLVILENQIQTIIFKENNNFDKFRTI